MAVERTLIIIKPDGVQRNLVGEILGRFEKRGLRIAAMKLMKISKATAEQHYEAHKEKSFFAPTVAYMTSEPVVVMVLEGPGAIDSSRATMGATHPAKAAPGTIRADLAMDISRNLVHGSDGAEAAEREIGLYFKPEEVLGYQRAADKWLND